MKQRALTVVAPIRGDRHQVREDLLRIGTDVRTPGSNPFQGHGDLHFLSCCIIDGVDGPASVVLELSFDGPVRKFLGSFVEAKRAALDQILRHCDGYPDASAGTAEIVTYLRKWNVRANAFYRGHPGRTVSRIEDERTLRDALRRHLGNARFQTRGELWKWLRGQVKLGRSRRLPFWVRFSPRGNRGPKRVAKGLRLLMGGVARGVGIAAFAALIWWAWHEGSLSFAVAVSLGPLLFGLFVSEHVVREGPKHVTWAGRRTVLWEAIKRGAVAYLFLGVVIGLVALVVDVWRRPWASAWPPLEPAMVALRAGLEFLGVALEGTLALLLLASTVAVAYVLVGWRTAAFVAAFVVTVTIGVTMVVAVPEPALVLLGSFFAALFLFLLLLAVASVYLGSLRRREQQDEVGGIRWENVHLARVKAHEDLQLQNHFATVTTVKDSLRLWQLGAVLRLAKLFVTFFFNQGDLAGIPSIHFARFVILRDRRQLLFQANYDGGWANYLGEFTQVPGVTAVWGNTLLFPRSFLIFGDGARDEQRYKTRARSSQVETLVWHSAYPGLAVGDVNRNTGLRDELSRPLDDRDRKGWFAEVWRFWKRPLDEVGLDEAIRRI